MTPNQTRQVGNITTFFFETRRTEGDTRAEEEEEEKAQQKCSLSENRASRAGLAMVRTGLCLRRG